MSNQRNTVASELDEDGNGMMWYYNRIGMTTHYIVYRNHRVSRVMIFDEECKEVGVLQDEDKGTFTKKTERNTADGLVRTTITRTNKN